MAAQTNKKYPNETIRLLHERASVRDYLDKPIEPEIMKAVLNAGIHAPSGGNLQPYSIIKIEQQDTKEKLAELCWQKFIGKAAVNLIFCLDLRRHKRLADIGSAPHTAYHSFRHFWVSFQDSIIAAQNICTAADAFGLGSCYIATILERFEDIIEICNIPEGVFPVVLLCLGYPRTKPQLTKKFELEIMVHDETYKDVPDDKLFKAYTERENQRKIKITEERLNQFRKVCVQTHGETFADSCLEKIKKNGYINPVQYQFGLHYPADDMAKGNRDFLALFAKMGLDWFKEWQPYKQGAQNSDSINSGR